MQERSSFGYWVRRRRKALDLTQHALAEQVGCAAITIRKIEADELRPSAQIAERLAACLQLEGDERLVFLKFARARWSDEVSPLPTRPIASRVRFYARQPALPTQPTALVGREREVADVRHLLHHVDGRLVTLTGPGGVGKTRVAVQAAAELLSDFQDGIWFVDLTPLQDSSLVIATIARVLGLKESGTHGPGEQVAAYLRHRQLLLVLDNFEQVLGAATLIADLLIAAPQLRVLVTSRVVLRLRSEKAYEMPPLSLPDPQQLPPLSSLAQYAGVALFIQRAQDVRPGFQLSAANAPAIVTICRCLDGLPLAIELAAAWVKIFTPEALVERLSSPLRMLTDGPRDLPPRQQTLRATINWSYSLLNQAERTLFRRLAVFVGGWTLETVMAICPLGGDLPEELLGLMRALVDQSLIRASNHGDGEPRFTMLETIHEYAWECLQEAGETNTLQEQHATHYLSLAETAESELAGPHLLVWSNKLVAEYDNLRAALRWCHQASDGVERELRFVAGLSQFWIVRGYRSESRAWLTAALERSTGVESRARAHALHRLAWFTENAAQGQRLYQESLVLGRKFGDKRAIAYALRGAGNTTDDASMAEQWRAESLALFSAIGDTWGSAWVLNNQGMAAAKQRHFAQADTLLAASLTLARSHGNPWLISTVLLAVGEISLLRGDLERASALLAEGITYARVGDNAGEIGATLLMMGHVARAKGHDARAASYYEESLGLAQKIGDLLLIARIRHNQAYIALHTGDVAAATVSLLESLTISHEMNNPGQMAWGLMALGCTAAAAGYAERAAWLFGTAEQHFADINQWIGQTEQAEHDHNIAVARAQLGEASFSAELSKGAALSVTEATLQLLAADKKQRLPWL